MKNLKDFHLHLLSKGYALRTAYSHQSAVAAYLNWADSQPETYDTVMEYVKHCKEKANSVNTIRMKLKALDHYFEFLGVRENPVKKIRLKGQTHKLPTRLLSQKELDEIYDLQPTGGLVAKRNKALLGLAIYQGASTKELSQIEITDLNLQKGTIYIPKGRSSNSRTLDLKPHQLLLLQDYLVKVRPTLAQEYRVESSKLFFSTGKGSNLLQNTVCVLLRKLRPQYPKLKDLKQIRQSVITLWVEQYGLRKAQYMAGHRYVSSTERYQREHLEGVKNELKTHHPMEALF